MGPTIGFVTHEEEQVTKKEKKKSLWLADDLCVCVCVVGGNDDITERQHNRPLFCDRKFPGDTRARCREKRNGVVVVVDDGEDRPINMATDGAEQTDSRRHTKKKRRQKPQSRKWL